MAEPFRHEVPGLKRFEDILVCDTFPEDKIRRLQDMELEPTDVVIASYPKTATTLLQEIVYLIRNHGNVEAANQSLNVDRVPYIEIGCRDNFAAFENLLHPRHMKTHVPYRFLPKSARDGKVKIVYIIRNPKDTLVSYYHFYRMCKCYNNFKGTWDDYFNYFMANGAMVGYGNPIDHFRGYWEHKDDSNMHIVFYESVVREPVKAVREIAQFLGCALSDDVIKRIAMATSFKSMKKNPMTNMGEGQGRCELGDHTISPFMRKGVVGDWKNYFTTDQSDIIDNMVKERLKSLDLQFTYE